MTVHVLRPYMECDDPRDSLWSDFCCDVVRWRLPGCTRRSDMEKDRGTGACKMRITPHPRDTMSANVEANFLSVGSLFVVQISAQQI